MAWESYGLDQLAQQLVLDAKAREPQSLNQAYKMRMATAYGLERFWGEHLRLQRREMNASLFWQETWAALVTVMARAGVNLPNQRVNPDDIASIRAISEALWQLPLNDQRVALAVLTQLCDSLVWWTQRYKG
ncbi:hypothetical protein [Phormidium sp. FACHB-1136]|uniref:hypothetical protein n=1 Tax=Phormidium sp. FACHB-1136 TaxID=2692848 RepID=UPI0016885A19|nr:hypothetical protein [Phormidium sp. FACHB-1136]MBD2428488.1 hypothetical protein [Phormidium sp. FACHB-1136]